MTARDRSWLVPAALVALTLVAYWPVHAFDFVSFDDPVYILDNPHVRAGLAWSGVVWAFTSTYAANWHPLTWLSHMADVSLFGLSAGGHHVVNLALHSLNAVLVWLLFHRATGSVVRSAVVAALFAVHPLHVESVAWVAERKDLLSATFALATMLAYVAWARRPTTGRYVAVVLWFACGLMAKPMVVTLPFVLLLLDAWPLGRANVRRVADAFRPVTWSRLVVEKLPLFALAAAGSVITMAAQTAGGAVASLEVVSGSARLANTFTSYMTYLRKTVWPDDLAVFYPLDREPSYLLAAAALLALATVTAFALRAIGHRPYLAVGWLWFIGMLVPVTGLVRYGAQALADRYTYLPHVGLFAAVVWGVASLSQSARARRGAVAVGAVLVLALTMATRAQVAHWQNGLTLWQRAVAVTTANPRAHANLGATLAAAGRHAEAVEQYRRSLALDPDLPQTYNNLGLSLDEIGQHAEALARFEEAVRRRPDYVEARNNLGNALMDAGRAAEAIVHFEYATRLEPGHAKRHSNLAAAYAAEGRFREALTSSLEAVRLEPDRADWHYTAGLAYAALGQIDRAVASMRAALARDPNHAMARAALADLMRPPGGG